MCICLKSKAAGGLVPPSNDFSWSPSSHFLVEHINPAAVGLGPASSQHLRSRPLLAFRHVSSHQNYFFGTEEEYSEVSL